MIESKELIKLRDDFINLAVGTLNDSDLELYYSIMDNGYTEAIEEKRKRNDISKII